MKRLSVLLLPVLLACNATQPSEAPLAPNFASSGGFDAFGYNRTARIFNGTCLSWATEQGGDGSWCGSYVNDKLVMKWNAEWDRGNDEGWANGPYDAWINNEWNGNCKGCSGSVWHYKIKWIGACGADYTPLPDGGYCLWGQFEVLMDQGHDPSYGPGHLWFAHAKPNGYGN